MSTVPEPERPQQPEATSQPSIRVDTIVVAAEMRDNFDARLRDATGLATPLPQLSEAIVAHDASGNVVGAIYIGMHHLASPFVLGEDAPATVLQALTDAIDARMREHLAATIERESEDRGAGDDTERQVLYDIYVPDGLPEPQGFERLPVSVWRRRVL